MLAWQLSRGPSSLETFIWSSGGSLPISTPRLTPVITDTDDELVYEFDVSGYRRRDLAVEVRDGTVEIRGHRKPRWFSWNRHASSFSRRFAIPSGIDPASIQACARRGQLSIRMSKLPWAHRRRIPIVTAA